MSKIFYDRLLVLDEVESEIKAKAQSREEREELWGLVDEIVHHKLMGCVLEKLPQEHYHTFLERFEKSPQDEGLFTFLTEKIGEDIESFLKEEIAKLKVEMLKLIKANK